MSADQQDEELVRGWIAAQSGAQFRIFASRPWRRGWRLWHTREKYRRKYQAKEMSLAA
jgi:hypothetical protein